MLRLYLIQRTDSFEKTLMLGKIEGRRRRDNIGLEEAQVVNECCCT